MSEMIRRYVIKKEAFHYILFDNAKQCTIISTRGLCGDEEGTIIAKQVLEYALRLLDKTHRPTKTLNKTAYIMGTGEEIALDEEGNELLIRDDEIVSVNDKPVTCNQREYYNLEYGLSKEATLDKKSIKLKELFKLQ